jgi:hypothetical protein
MRKGCDLWHASPRRHIAQCAGTVAPGQHLGVAQQQFSADLWRHRVGQNGESSIAPAGARLLGKVCDTRSATLISVPNGILTAAAIRII